MALTFTDIHSPVGIRNGQTKLTNAPADLAIVTDLFDRISMDNGGSAENFGVWSKNRDDLIQEVADQIVVFQKANGMTVVDGALDPGGRTLKLMNKLAADKLVTPIQGNPGWEDWGTDRLPQIIHSKEPEIDWELTLAEPGQLRAMDTRAYVCDKALGTPHIGISWPLGLKKPSAYLIYFHHSIGQEGTDYVPAGVRFKKGIGDYLIGRMRGSMQVALSGKNVCLVVPEPTFAGQGIFSYNEKLIAETLKEIDADLSEETRDLPPLLVASYSDGLGLMEHFMENCPGLRKSVKAMYDFDGLYVKRFAKYTLSDWANGGARVFRYVGNSSPPFAGKETKLGYLTRCINQSPKIIPLQKSRWVNHPHFDEFKKKPAWAESWWMHIYIPSCMLFHGLANTDGI